MAQPIPPRTGPSEDHLTDRLLAGRYRLNTHIASGGMAEVWEATDETLARRVAIKILHRHLATDDSFVQRFRAEAIAAARLAHPSIVSVYDTCSVDGLEAIIMELVVGTTMRADLDAHGPMRLEAVLAIGTQVADALGAAHASGLVHRDVKPANILLSADGRVLVADFGIAKAAEGTDLTTVGSMVGTAKYLAPEQVEGGPIDGRADLYSLGVVLYEAATGVAPFLAETDAATALARLHRDPAPPRTHRADLSPAVEAVILQALQRDPARRFATASAMREALVSAGARPGAAPRAAAVAAATAEPSAPSTPLIAAGPPTSTARSLAAPPPPPPPPAPPAPRSPADDTHHPTDEVHRPRRWKLALIFAVLAAVVAGFSIIDDNASDPTGEPVTIASATSFDPQGDTLEENQAQVGNVIDGDDATTWSSERYRDPVDLAGKDGVGLALTLDATREVDGLDVAAIEGGWSAQVYVGSGPAPADLAGWGEPVASVSQVASGPSTMRFPATTGDRVLLWFTRLPPSGAVEVRGVTVRAR